jgi:hypothetical protein
MRMGKKYLITGKLHKPKLNVMKPLATNNNTLNINKNNVYGNITL